MFKKYIIITIFLFINLTSCDWCDGPGRPDFKVPPDYTQYVKFTTDVDSEPCNEFPAPCGRRWYMVNTSSDFKFSISYRKVISTNGDQTEVQDRQIIKPLEQIPFSCDEICAPGQITVITYVIDEGSVRN